jgi:hypothetical protein
MPVRRASCAVAGLCALSLVVPVAAQGVRERMRLKGAKGTTVTESQAAVLTLTVSPVTSKFVETWLRTSGTPDASGKRLTAPLVGPDAALIKVGQRARAFPPSSKSSMYQAFVTRVAPGPGGPVAEVTLASAGRPDTPRYVVEIVVERGPLLSIPNEAIIEEGDRHLVYVKKDGGEYVPQEIQTGIQGELYTEVLSGLNEGDQVVTFGSFFIDAEHKLKGVEQGPSAP